MRRAGEKTWLQRRGGGALGPDAGVAVAAAFFIGTVLGVGTPRAQPVVAQPPSAQPAKTPSSAPDAAPPRPPVPPDLEPRRIDVERRLARIAGHASAKASVRWPFDVARQVALGIRRLGTNDFGLREDGTQAFDFDKELRESEELLVQLEAGRDPLARARGDHERHYYFPEASEILPYRIYVPRNWDGRSRLRLLLVLHGATRDHDFYFDRDGGLLPRLAEERGWMVVCPLGYRPNAGYNAGVHDRAGELSEKDVRRVLELVRQEYPIDRARTYLFGHSAGGAGGWYLGAKYADEFAGLASSATGTRPESVPFDKLKGRALMAIVGTRDAPATVSRVREMSRALSEHGLPHEYLEVEGADHATIVALALPKVFDLFDRHSRVMEPRRPVPRGAQAPSGTRP